MDKITLYNKALYKLYLRAYADSLGHTCFQNCAIMRQVHEDFTEWANNDLSMNDSRIPRKARKILAINKLDALIKSHGTPYYDEHGLESNLGRPSFEN